MTTSAPPTPAQPSPGPHRSRWRSHLKVASEIAAILAVIVGAVALWGPLGGGDDAGEPAAPGTAASRPAAPAPDATTAGPAARLTYLDTIAPEVGGGTLRRLPRELTGAPGYTRPIVIQCAGAQAVDKVVRVVWSLRGRFLDFAAGVRPFFARDDGYQVEVMAQVGVRQPNGALQESVAATVPSATADDPGRLAASVAGAAELTITVRCEWPDGVVVLTDAALTGDR